METLGSDWEQSDVSEDGENSSLEKYQLEADPLDLIQNDIHEMNLQTMHTKKIIWFSEKDMFVELTLSTNEVG